MTPAEHSAWLDELATKMGLESNWREVKPLPMGPRDPMPLESLACWHRTEDQPKTFAWDYPAFKRAETQARRADRYAWQVAKLKAQPTVCEVKETQPIESTMDALETRGLLYGKHNGVEWKMSPALWEEITAMQSCEAWRYAYAHRRWITEKAMQKKGFISEFRSLSEILEKSRKFPK